MDIKTALSEFMKRKNKDVNVVGKNPNIETYYKIWQGNADWLNIKVWMPTQEFVNGKMKSFHIEKYIPRDWANNYANEDTQIVLQDDKSHKTLHKIFKDNNFFGRLNNFTEMFFALGIGAMVVGIDNLTYNEDGSIDQNNKASVKIRYVSGRRIYPITINDGEVTECAFATFGSNECKLIIHWLDDQNNYVITELKGKMKTDNNQNLDDYSFDFDNTFDFLTHSNIALFTIWRPNFCDSDEQDFDISTSIYKGCFDIFEQIDMCYTMFYDEFNNGRKIKFIAPSMVERDANGKTKLLCNPLDSSVIVLPEGENGQNFVTEFNGELRGSQIIDAINFHLNMASMLCGLGSNHFEFGANGGGRPIQTATGVIAKNTELYKNIIKQENFAREQLIKLVNAIAFVNNEFTMNDKIVIGDEIKITFDDNIIADDESKRKDALAEVEKGIMTISEFRSEFGNLSEDEALQTTQEYALMGNYYLNMLNSGAMLIDQYVDIVYGENCKYRQQIIDKWNSKDQMIDQFQDESDEVETDEQETEATAEQSRTIQE